MGFDIERMCRLNGQKPTMRDRWVAFHRLYRMAMTGDIYRDSDAADCFRVLFANPSMFRLLEAEGPAARVGLPTVLRQKFLEMDKRKRLYGPNWEWMDRDKRVATSLHEEGREVTPTEVAEVRRKIIDGVRSRWAARGKLHLLPDDAELWEEIARAIKEKP